MDSDHLVLCGAADSFLPFLLELRRTSDIPVTVIYHSSEFSDFTSLMEMPDVNFVEGSPTDKDILEEAHIHNARLKIWSPLEKSQL